MLGHGRAAEAQQQARRALQRGGGAGGPRNIRSRARVRPALYLKKKKQVRALFIALFDFDVYRVNSWRD